MRHLMLIMLAVLGLVLEVPADDADDARCPAACVGMGGS